ncbi:MAG: hypothetical protein GY929_14120 [Actinomycetia bacterium]|nr:hypothetical protein [Actinomycetes bacterium]
MAQARLEFLVEPFVINDPGPHVQAAVQTIEAAGLPAEMGPFATTTTGELTDLLDAVSHMLTAGFAAGATGIQLRVELGSHD